MRRAARRATCLRRDEFSSELEDAAPLLVCLDDFNSLSRDSFASSQPLQRRGERIG